MKKIVLLFALIAAQGASAASLNFICKADKRRNAFSIDAIKIYLDLDSTGAKVVIAFEDGTTRESMMTYEGKEPNAHFELTPRTAADGDKYISMFRFRGAWVAGVQSTATGGDTHANCHGQNGSLF